jgi:hypothetical protein
VVLSADSISIHPLTQSGQLTPASGSSIIPMDGSNLDSIGFQVFLSQTTNLPEGQLQAVSMAIFLDLG